ncbi:MAG: hypothetical protein RL685_3880 [Pseudomonadota bacterium]|jgi:uncharacterized iron-regulated membrane protein
MKLRPRTFQIYWDAHAWSGVVAALLLHVMFFMGAFALFQHELDRWASSPAPSGDSAPALQPLLEQLHAEQPLFGKRRVAFQLEPSGVTAHWRAGKEQHSFQYSAAAGKLVPLRSELGSFLYELHYLGPIPNGIYAAGVASLALLLALVTGVLIHWKDLLRQWFQFRPERVMRTWSSDVHKVLGVFGLPYLLLYAWSGAVLCLAVKTVEPALEAALFQGDEHAARIARGSGERPPRPSGHLTGRLPDVDGALATAQRELPGLRPTWVGIEHVGDERSTVHIFGALPGLALATADVTVEASSGRVLQVLPPDGSHFRRFEAWFYGLHYARFGGYGVRILYALLALASCAVIVTGNLVWLERRDLRRAHWGNRLLERLTAGWCAGVVLATGAALLANRLLGFGSGESTGAEQWAFWLVWGLAIAAPFVARSSRRVAAYQLLLAAAALGGALLLEVSANGLGDPLRNGISAGLTGLALCAAAGGAALLRPRRTQAQGTAMLARSREATLAAE